ncbi:MAG: hypothetical protein ACI4IJ_01415 [Acutalibacteraceae bacterium]
MKEIYICSPFGRDCAENVEKATQYSKYVLSFGLAPSAFQMYSHTLDLSKPSEFRLSREVCKRKLWNCEEMWVFGDCVTPEMREEISIFRAIKGAHARVRYISEAEIRRFFRRRKRRRRR